MREAWRHRVPTENASVRVFFVARRARAPWIHSKNVFERFLNVFIIRNASINVTECSILIPCLVCYGVLPLSHFQIDGQCSMINYNRVSQSLIQHAQSYFTPSSVTHTSDYIH